MNHFKPGCLYYMVSSKDAHYLLDIKETKTGLSARRGSPYTDGRRVKFHGTNILRPVQNVTIGSYAGFIHHETEKHASAAVLFVHVAGSLLTDDQKEQAQDILKNYIKEKTNA